MALEAVKGVKTLAALAAEYKVHPNQIASWQNQLLTKAPELFAPGNELRGKSEEELTSPLHEGSGLPIGGASP